MSEEAIFSENNGKGVRWATALGGGALVLYAMRQRSWTSPFVAAAGTVLVYRSTTGQYPAQELLERVTNTADSGIHVHKAVTIQRSPDDVYDFWRRLENLPRFMHHLHEVEDLGEGRSRWHARLPASMPVSWEAIIVGDEPGRLLQWETAPDATVQHHGQVRFLDAGGDRGTELHVDMRYRPPLGVAGAAVAQLFNTITEQQIKEDIRRCKHILEAGEIPTTDGQPSGRSKS